MEAVKKYLARHPFASKGGFVFLFAFAAFAWLLPSPAEAAVLETIFGGAFDFVLPLLLGWTIFPLYLVLTLIVLVLGFIPVFISGIILNLVIEGHIINLPLTRGGIVDIGWTISRDLANISLIAIVVAMAIRNILGDEQRGVRLLPKLIGIALLINFTKVIAGGVVDVANIITNYFLTPVKDVGNLFLQIFGQNTPAWRLVEGFIGLFGSLSGGNFMEIINFLRDNFSSTAILTATVTSIALAIVGLLTAFTLLVYAAVFLMRYIAIWILVMASPLAFAALILPETTSWFKKWWQNFTHWAFIGVGPAFVLFIVAQLIEGRGDVRGAITASIATNTEAYRVTPAGIIGIFIAPLHGVINELLFWVIVITLMWMGLLMALKMNDMVNKFAGAKITGALKGLGTFAAKTGWRMAGKGVPRLVGAKPMLGGKWLAERMRLDVGLRRVGGVIERRIPERWKKDYAEKRYQRASSIRQIDMLTKAGLMGQKNRVGNTINSRAHTPWNDLTDNQQKAFMLQGRLKVTKVAETALGKGKGWGMKAAKMTWDEFTPEEQKAISSAISLEKIWAAQGKAVQNAIALFEKLDLSVRELLETYKKETNPNKRLAAAKMISDKVPRLEFERAFPEEKDQVNIAKELQRLNLSKELTELFAAQPQLIEQVIQEADKIARAYNKAAAEFNRKMEDVYKDLETLTNEQIKELMDRGNNAMKVAGARMLAERQKFDDPTLLISEQKELLDLARQYKREYLILKRYFHLARSQDEAKETLRHMTNADHQNINVKIIQDTTPTGREKLRWWFANINVEKFIEALKTPAFRQELVQQLKDSDDGPDLKTLFETHNKVIYDAMKDNVAKKRAYSVPEFS